MTKKILILLSISLFTLGCSEKPKINPNELPIAYVGQPYSQDIIITGGSVIGHQLQLNTNFPNDMGISFNNIKDDNDDIYANNHLTISGTAKYKGIYKIKISTMFYGGKGKYLEKEYLFTVQ